MLHARPECGVIRRAVCRLYAVEARRARNFAVAQKLGVTAVAAQHVGAVADRDHHVIGGAEAELLPQFVGERLGPFREERLPVVAGIEDVPAHGERRVSHVLAREPLTVTTSAPHAAICTIFGYDAVSGTRMRQSMPAAAQ